MVYNYAFLFDNFKIFINNSSDGYELLKIFKNINFSLVVDSDIEFNKNDDKIFDNITDLSLHYDNNKIFTNDKISKLLKLKELAIWTNYVTDDAIKNLTNLTHLKLHNKIITDDGIKNLQN